jgi:hypothetical protein
VVPRLDLTRARAAGPDAQLTEALGDEYEHFAAERKRLVPGVW